MTLKRIINIKCIANIKNKIAENKTCSLKEPLTHEHTIFCVAGQDCIYLESLLELIKSNEHWKDAAFFRIVTAFVNSTVVNIIVTDNEKYYYAGFIRILSDNATTAIIQDIILHDDIKDRAEEILSITAKLLAFDTCKYVTILSYNKNEHSTTFNHEKFERSLNNSTTYVNASCYDEDELKQKYADALAEKDKKQRENK